jgi:hypothetical protein
MLYQAGAVLELVACCKKSWWWWWKSQMGVECLVRAEEQQAVDPKLV